VSIFYLHILVAARLEAKLIFHFKLK